ncbi:MAG: RluA family pseudouridine synthase [Planctomycetota bacterium]
MPAPGSPSPAFPENPDPSSAPPADTDPNARYHAATLEDLEETGAEHRVYHLTTDSTQRLDKYLQNRLKGISRNQIQKLIALGGVTVNGKSVKPSLSLRTGDTVEVVVPPKPAVDLRPEPIRLDILYEDDDMVAVNKQANLIVHPARKYKSGTMINALAHHFQNPGFNTPRVDERTRPPAASDAGLSEVGQQDQRPGVVHRLDMNTTGVILFAKQDATHWLLAKQFEDRTNLKCYLALVHGCPDPPSGSIDQPLGKHPTIREGHAVRHDAAGKESLTFYRVRRRYRGYSLIECELKSGRTHQIRVHLSFLGFPIVGDQLYGGETVGPPELADPPLAAGSRPNLNFARTKAEGQKIESDAAERAATGESPLMATPALHAALLRIHHPVFKTHRTFTAPLHRPMLDLIQTLEAHHHAPGETITDGTHVDLATALPGIDLKPSR